MHGIFLDTGSVGPSDLDLSPLHRVLEPLNLPDQTPPDEILEQATDASVIITNKNALTGVILGKLPKLRLIVVAATGTDNIDLKAAASNAICVCNCRDYATASVAQHTMMLILNLLTGFPASGQRALAQWSSGRHFCHLDGSITEIAGLSLGLVGYGTLGQAVGQMATALGMQLLIAQHPDRAPVPGRLPLEEVLARADVVSLHCPLNTTTRGLIDRQALALMKPSAFLVNTARGALIVDVDLIEALHTGQVAGAALDVLDVEPPPANHPMLDRRIPGLILTPHIAWASQAARQQLINQVAMLVQAFKSGKPCNQVLAQQL